MFQAFNLIPRTSARWPTSSCPWPIAAIKGRERRELAIEALTRVGLAEPHGPRADRALGRTAAARGHRASARHPSLAAARGRADRCPGLAVLRRGPRRCSTRSTRTTARSSSSHMRPRSPPTRSGSSGCATDSSSPTRQWSPHEPQGDRALRPARAECEPTALSTDHARHPHRRRRGDRAGRGRQRLLRCRAKESDPARHQLTDRAQRSARPLRPRHDRCCVRLVHAQADHQRRRRAVRHRVRRRTSRPRRR